MSRPITVGTAGNRAFFRILDQDGNPWTARAFNAAGLSIYYLDTTTGALVSLTPTVSTWVERPGGWYALEVPDSVYATAIRSLIFGGVITGGTVWGGVQDVVPVVQTKADADDDHVTLIADIASLDEAIGELGLDSIGNQDAIIATVDAIKAVTDLVTETRLAKLDRDLAAVADVNVDAVLVAALVAGIAAAVNAAESADGKLPVDMIARLDYLAGQLAAATLSTPASEIPVGGDLAIDAGDDYSGAQSLRIDIESSDDLTGQHLILAAKGRNNGGSFAVRMPIEGTAPAHFASFDPAGTRTAEWPAGSWELRYRIENADEKLRTIARANLTIRAFVTPQPVVDI